jgi:hypothetical protein
LENLDNNLLFNIIKSEDKVNNNKEVNEEEVNYNTNKKYILDYNINDLFNQYVNEILKNSGWYK